MYPIHNMGTTKLLYQFMTCCPMCLVIIETVKNMNFKHLETDMIIG